MAHTETIAALATPPGRGGVGIVRVSGPESGRIARAIVQHEIKPRFAHYLPFYATDGQIIDQGLALLFVQPHSFTGEDVLELHGHGGPVVMDLLLKTVLEHGARLARPGEFSERAFLNDKLDLAQAEAIADLIDAGSVQAARSAMRSLQGEFSRAIQDLVEAMTRLRVYVEAAMDFPEEEIDFLSEGNVARQVDELIATLTSILSQAQQGSLMREGISVVLAGRPNAGKSSLLNTLSQREAAIVTEIPGTTRDIVREEINLDGIPLHVQDTAGLRSSEDRVELEGIRRTWQAIEQADMLLLLVDDSEGFGQPEQEVIDRSREHVPVIIIYNKCDLSGRPVGIMKSTEPAEVAISASQARGLDDLAGLIKQMAGARPIAEGAFMARRRHLVALKNALAHLELARQQAQVGQGELVAEELKHVQDALGRITGAVSSDDLLGEIFSSFCIGK